MTRIHPWLLALALAAPLAAQDGDEIGDGRWFRLATEGDAPPSAGAPAEARIDPAALVDIADRAAVLAGQLAAAQTHGGVQGGQREVEERLTALIGILEREGG